MASSSNLLSAPSLADAQRASSEFAKEQCARLNTSLIQRYNSNFDSWKTEVVAGKRKPENPPMPPNRWDPFLFDDGFTYEVRGLEQVCPRRTDIPPDYTQPQIPARGHVDRISIGRFDSARRGDLRRGDELIALGYNEAEVGSPSSLWGVAEIASPFGTYRFYERLSG